MKRQLVVRRYTQTSSIARVVIVGHGTALRLVLQHHLRVITQLHQQGEYQEVGWSF